MRILISGAGIAGLTLAYWLKYYGFTPTIVERAPSLLTGGYKIDVRGSALEVLRRMGVYNTVVSESTDMQGALLVNKDGKVISEMSGDAFGHRVNDDIEIIRGKLCQILKNQIPDIEYIFGDSIQQIFQHANEVEINFQHHPSQRYDLIIGADGLHSTVRRLTFGEESKFLYNLGLHLCVFTVPNYLNLDRLEVQYTEFGRVAAIWSARGENNMRACFAFSDPSNSIDLRNRKNQEEILRKVFQGINWEVPKLLQMMPNSSDFYFDSAAQINMNQWHQDRVVLVGDAAYCASPMSGQGTSLALIGAYILAGELVAAKGNYKIAFDEYEKQMRPFVKINQELGKTGAKRMRAGENASFISKLFMWILKLTPGFFIKLIINISSRRIHQAANSIQLKNYRL